MVALLSGLSLAGCGSDQDTGPASGPRAVAERWVEDVNAGDLEAACRVMVPASKPCPALVEELPDPPLRGLAPHSLGRRLPRGDEAFSVEGASGDIVITVSGRPVDRRLEVEAVILR